VLRVEIGGERIAAEIVRIGTALFAPGFQLRAALGDDLVFVGGGAAGELVVSDIVDPINERRGPRSEERSYRS